MLTIVETPTFLADADRLWSEEERLEFFAWLAAHPEAGDVSSGSGGCRKVRWSRAGVGKRGGARAIYFVRTRSGELWMLVAYSKGVRENIPAHILREIKRELEK
jgi:hypothetical protein